MNSNLIRFIVFLGVVSILCFTTLFYNYNTVFQILQINTVEVFVPKTINVKNLKTQQNGIGSVFTCSTTEFTKFSRIYDFDGIAFCCQLTPDQIIEKLKAKIHSTQRLSNKKNTKQIYYCYFNGFNKSITIDNKKINLQICFDGEKSIIGLPILLGSY